MSAFRQKVKIIKRILLVLLAIVLLAQVPFIYRRWQTGKLAEKIAQLQSQRTTAENPDFNEYKGIIHAHTSLGGHSTGTFEELIAAANANDLDFVLMTEHYTDAFDTSALTLNGVHGKTLFVGGNEIDTSDSDRFLLIPGSVDAASFVKTSTADFLNKAHSGNKLALITYPERFKSWDSNFDGIEVFSLHTSAKQMNWLTAFFDVIWTYPSYPELMFARYFERPDTNLQKFDEIAASRKISLFAGTDAHSNLGFHLFGDDAGNKLINIKLDPYETTFRLARLHVLIEKDKPFTRENLIEAMKNGRYYVGLDVLGDSNGFVFFAETRQGNGFMGHEISLGHGLTLKASSPNPARFALFRNGELIVESEVSTEFSAIPTVPGTYRLEVYLDQLGLPFDKMPWIISNPIYVR